MKRAARRPPRAVEPDKPALSAAREILELRSNAPRLWGNTLVLLAAERPAFEGTPCETYRWLLAPEQQKGTAAPNLAGVSPSSTEPLAVQDSRKASHRRGDACASHARRHPAADVAPDAFAFGESDDRVGRHRGCDTRGLLVEPHVARASTGR